MCVSYRTLLRSEPVSVTVWASGTTRRRQWSGWAWWRWLPSPVFSAKKGPCPQQPSLKAAAWPTSSQPATVDVTAKLLKLLWERGRYKDILIYMFNYSIYVIGSGRSNAYIFLVYILLIKGRNTRGSEGRVTSGLVAGERGKRRDLS